MPVLAASRWAATAQARIRSRSRTSRPPTCAPNIAVATAQAYLAIIALKREVEVTQRALETSLAHLDYARRRLEAGAGTRLNELRAGQEVATNEARLETAQLGVRRAQEALGVLIVVERSGRTRPASRCSTSRPSPTKPDGWRCGPMFGSSPQRNARPIASGGTARRTGFPPPSRRSIRRRSCRRASSARREAGGLS